MDTACCYSIRMWELQKITKVQ